MKNRLIFLGAAVFFSVAATVGFAIMHTFGDTLRSWILFISCVVFTVLSLIGVAAPQKMQWLMDAFKKKPKS